jgi:low molecular weight protein-tyrosine phosphatase
MAQGSQQVVLFLCTGNYYRSRFAECLFNSVASKFGLAWRAVSRGLALERGVGNVGPIAQEAIKGLEALGIRDGEACSRFPVPVAVSDLENAALVIALKDAEHRPLLEERFPVWATRVEFWQVDDAPGALTLVEQEVMQLIARLCGGGTRPIPASPPEATATTKKESKSIPVVKVGRETKGRRGKGVTTVFDTPLDADELIALATRLKERCGTGGTVKDGRIEIQGDQRERVITELEKLGYRVKKVGG